MHLCAVEAKSDFQLIVEGRITRKFWAKPTAKENPPPYSLSYTPVDNLEAKLPGSLKRIPINIHRYKVDFAHLFLKYFLNVPHHVLQVVHVPPLWEGFNLYNRHLTIPHQDIHLNKPTLQPRHTPIPVKVGKPLNPTRLNTLPLKNLPKRPKKRPLKVGSPPAPHPTQGNLQPIIQPPNILVEQRDLGVEVLS